MSMKVYFSISESFIISPILLKVNGFGENPLIVTRKELSISLNYNLYRKMKANLLNQLYFYQPFLIFYLLC